MPDRPEIVCICGSTRFVDEMRAADEIPPFEDLMEAIAMLLDQALMPAGGGDANAGKTIIQNFATSALAQVEQHHITQMRHAPTAQAARAETSELP